MKDTHKKALCAIFLVVLFAPALLGVISVMFKDKNFDVDLLGYTDVIDRPNLTRESYASGKFQKDCASWFESKLKPRGIMIKTYGTIRYNLFNLGNEVIGSNNDIFQENYITTEFALASAYDMANADSSARVDGYVAALEETRQKLETMGKTLYVYVGANKAEFHSENVPRKYREMKPEGSVNITDYFRSGLGQTAVPYKICSDLKTELVYPAFYPTGIHWSRTFEQTVSSQIIAELSDITGKNYRDLILGNVRESKEPFWRDSDVFNLLNVWNRVDCTYYEYEIEKDNADVYDKMRFLIVGDSFALGLRTDILSTYPDEEVYTIQYDQYIQMPDGSRNELNHNWETLDLQYYLDNTDVIILGFTEPNIVNCSDGFIQYLNAFLDTYQPGAME